MKKLMLMLAAAAVVVAPAYANNYAEDRAQIENLMAQYLFAMDWQDAEAYSQTFTEDGVLIYGGGERRGRAAIKAMIEEGRANMLKRRAEDKSGLRPARTRHNITNMVITVNGDTAKARAYWFFASNNNEKRSATLGAYGHYEDDLVKRNGKWLFKQRQVFNEQLDRRAASDQNPTTKP